jgi:hypothetical protein
MYNTPGEDPLAQISLEGFQNTEGISNKPVTHEKKKGKVLGILQNYRWAFCLQ